MTVLHELVRADQDLAQDVLTHLEVQLASARGLLQVVLEQGTAIRARDVPAVVTLTGVLQTELQRRSSIELARAHLLEIGRASCRERVAISVVRVALREG